MPTNKPQYQIVDDKLVVQTSTQGEIRLPLSIKTKFFRQLKEINDELEQLFLILDSIGDTETPAKIDELDVFETMDLVGRFFKEFEAKAQARLGE